MNGTEEVSPPAHRRRSLPCIAAFVVAFIAYRVAMVDDLAGAGLANLCLYYAIIGLGFYWVFGVAGQFAFSHAVFVGVGAYASAWATHGGRSFFLGFAFAVATSVALSVFVVVLLRKTGGFSFAVGTIGIAQLVLLAFTRWDVVSHGAVGGQVLRVGDISVLGRVVDTDFEIFLVSIATLAVLLVITTMVERSPFKRHVEAVRDQREVAASLKIPVLSSLAGAFVLGSVIAAIAGSISAHTSGFVQPGSYDLSLMLGIFVTLIVGGYRSMWGPVVGALFYVYVPELARGLNEYRSILYGLMLIVVVVCFPGGIVSAISLLGRSRLAASLTGRIDATKGAVGLRRRGASTATVDAVPSPSNLAPVPRAPRGTVSRGDPSPGTVLDAEGVSVAFGGVRAVNDVSLALPEGDVLGIVGPNGSGKSSFLNALTGFVPARGTVRVRGEEVGLGDPGAIARAGVARTFQTPQVFMTLTCLENVLLGLADRQCSTPLAALAFRRRMLEVERRCWAESMSSLRRFGLGDKWDVPGGALSYGERRMLELARTTVSRPGVVLLDEPSAGLDTLETERLAVHLRALRDEGTTLLVVDHKIDFINDICDRVAVFESGRVVALGTPEDVWAQEQVVVAYLGDVVDAAAVGDA